MPDDLISHIAAKKRANDFWTTVAALGLGLSAVAVMAVVVEAMA